MGRLVNYLIVSARTWVDIATVSGEEDLQSRYGRHGRPMPGTLNSRYFEYRSAT